MKGSLTNSELHEFLHDFQSDETKENLEEFYLHNWERSCHADLPEGVSERVWNKLYSKFIPDRWNSGNLSMQRR